MTTPDSPLNFGQNNRFRDVHVGDSARRDVNKNLGDVVYGDKVVQAPFSPRPVAATPEERDAAMQRLAALPTDELPPAAGGLPPGSWLGGLGRNHQFVGREADLLALARMLKGGAHVAVNQAQSALASGLGGIGKTQLAVEFAYRYGPFFSGVFWLNCAQPDLLDTAIARCGGAGHLQLFTEAAGLTLDEQVGLVLARWGGGLPYLLIFDNCEEPELLRRYRPGGASRVLLTSRNAGWPGHLGVQRHPLGVLARAESLALLRQHRPSLNEAEADELARELGDLPLALYLAGRFLAGPGNTLSVARYLAELDSPRLFERLPLRAEDGALPTGHSRDVARTFALSYEQLNTANDSDGLALGLLARAAQLVPGTVVPADLLRATLEPDPDDLEAELATNSALERLLRLGLLEGEGDDSLRMHRLVGAYVGQVAGDNEAQPAVERAVRAWAAVLDAEPSLAPLTAFLPILQGVTDAALPRGDVAAADL
ncbi:MAG: hypothetical protein MUD01_23675, partial [Chloroflexaceae bacterium]|nr:hypothetical protein [Chloroflexaceae bacterium]